MYTVFLILLALADLALFGGLARLMCKMMPPKV